MKVSEGKQYANEILKLHPEYSLCGSLGLVLRGAILREKVADLDFACNRAEFKGGLDTYGDYGPTEHSGYTTYKVQGDNGWYYNLFVHDAPVESSVVEGMKVQSLDQMLYWKKQYNRPKDRQDLGI